MLRFIMIFVIMANPYAQVTQTPAPSAVYTVKPGDTGWALAGRYYDNPAIWQRIVDMNPFLQERGRVFEDIDPVTQEKKIILLLKPGERLEGLERLNIDPPKAMPIDAIAMPETKARTEATDFPWWAYILAGVAILLLIGAISTWYQQSELRRNPVTSGPPIIAGGVRPTETDRLSQAMQTAAVTEYIRRYPNVDRHSVRVERIGPIEEGMISGEGLVGYADRARPRRIDPPQPGYRARFRFPDGREDNLMSLQGCMNPCFYGEGLSGFNFTSREQVVPTPEPERPGPQAVPHPAIVARSIRAAAQAEGNTTVTIGDRVLTFERGVHLTVNEETGAISMEGQAFSMTIQPKRVRRSKPEAPRATGTSDK